MISSAAARNDRQLLDASSRLSVVDSVQGDIAAFGPLQRYFDDPDVTDVLINGPEGIWVDRGSGLEAVKSVFRDETQVRQFAQRLAARSGRRLDDSAPWVDGRLPDGTRLHAVLSPVAHPGTLISLRIPSRNQIRLADLVATGSLDISMVTELREVISERRSFLVTGGTGAGKTTILAAMLGEVAPDERIVVVEDSAELRPAHPHVVALEGRPPNVEGSGKISMGDLVRQALRMRPDRIVVGEVRGAEVAELLTALNTGHRGGCGTVHANSSQDVPARLAALGALAGMDRESTWLQTAAAIERIVHLERISTGQRIVKELSHFRIRDSGRLVVETLWRNENHR